MELGSVAWQGSELGLLDFLFDKHESLLTPEDSESLSDADILKDPGLLNLDSWDDLDDAFSMFLSDGPDIEKPSLSPPFHSGLNSPPSSNNNETFISILDEKVNSALLDRSPETWTPPYEDKSSSSDDFLQGSPQSGYSPHSDHCYGGFYSDDHCYGSSRATERRQSVVSDDEIKVVHMSEDLGTALDVDICADVEVTTSEFVESESDDGVLFVTSKDTKKTKSPSRQTSRGFGRQNSSYPQLKLTLEERRLYEAEDVPIPTRYPLTKEEEKELKRIRRKIRNKKSALDSRRRKKEYVSGLESRVKACTVESSELRKKVSALENHNRTLLSELRKLQSLFGVSTSRPTQTSTCLMILVLSFAFLLMPSITSFSNPPLPTSEVKGPSVKVSPEPSPKLPFGGDRTGSSAARATADFPGKPRSLLSKGGLVPDSPIPAKLTKNDNISRLLDDQQFVAEHNRKVARRSSDNEALSGRRGKYDGMSWGFRKLQSVSADPEDDPYRNPAKTEEDGKLSASYAVLPPNVSKAAPDDGRHFVNLPHRLI